MPDRAFRRWLGAITAVGAAWRIGYLVLAKLGDALLLNDSFYYSVQASRNADGEWFKEALTDLPGAEHGPLTSLWLTPWSLGGNDSDWHRAAMTLVGIVTVAVVGLAGRRLAGARVGLVAAAIAAAYPNLWLNDSLVMSESLACLLVALAILATLAWHDDPSPGRAALIGVTTGLAALARSELVLLAVGFAAIAWWHGRPLDIAQRPWLRRALAPLLIAGAAAGVLAPWAIYNLTRFDRPVVLSTNDGTTLLGANCEQAYYHDIGSWYLPCLGDAPDGADGSVRSAHWRSAAVRYARDHWQRLPIVAAARVGRTLDVYGLSSLVQLDTGEEKAGWAVWTGIAAWWSLAIGAIAGWRRLGRLGQPSVGVRWWLAVPPLAVLLTSVAFYGAHRIRAPAEPVVVLLAAVALTGAIERRTLRSE